MVEVGDRVIARSVTPDGRYKSDTVGRYLGAGTHQGWPYVILECEDGKVRQVAPFTPDMLLGA